MTTNWSITSSLSQAHKAKNIGQRPLWHCNKQINERQPFSLDNYCNPKDNLLHQCHNVTGLLLYNQLISLRFAATESVKMKTTSSIQFRLSGLSPNVVSFVIFLYCMLTSTCSLSVSILKLWDIYNLFYLQSNNCIAIITILIF